MAITSTPYAPFKARLVMGSLFDIKTTDHEGKPEASTNKHHWFMGFAVPKGPEWDVVWSTMYNAAANEPSCTAALCGQAGFGWKIEDCDAPSNPQNAGKTSYPAGHWLIKFARYSMMGPPPVCDGQFNPIVNKTAVKRGDYFFIDASTVFNGCATIKTNAGMYQNLNGVMFAEAGEEIISEGGFNATTAFAGMQGGMVANGATPQAGAPVAGAIVTPQAPQAPAAPQTPQAPAAPVTPATDLIGAAGAPPSPPALAATPEQGYMVQGVSYTKATLLAVDGYTEAHLATLPRG